MSINFELNDSLLLRKLSNEGYLCVATGKRRVEQNKTKSNLKEVRKFPLNLIMKNIHLLFALIRYPVVGLQYTFTHKTTHRTAQLTTLVGRLSGIRTQSGQTNWEECRPCPVFASYSLEFALQLRKRHGKTSVRVTEECKLAR